MKEKMIGQFQVVKNVTLSVFKLAAGVQRVFLFKTAMEVGKATAVKKGDKVMEPAVVATVIDLETGEEGTLICATVLRSEINAQYSGESYVGRAFAIKFYKVPEKTYNLYEIIEVKVPAEYQDAAPAPVAVPAKSKAK